MKDDKELGVLGIRSQAQSGVRSGRITRAAGDNRARRAVPAINDRPTGDETATTQTRNIKGGAGREHGRDRKGAAKGKRGGGLPQGVCAAVPTRRGAIPIADQRQRFYLINSSWG